MLRAVSDATGDGEGAAATQYAYYEVRGSGELDVEVIGVLEETSPSETSFVPVPLMDVEASPTMAVSYNIRPNGLLIPVNDNGNCFPVTSLDLDNTFILVTEVPSEEVISKPTIPPHLVDHTYAKTFKEPKKKAAKMKPKAAKSKPARRPEKKLLPAPPPYQRPPVKKEPIPVVMKELPIPVKKELPLPVNTSVNARKINIIRMNLPPPKEFEFVPLTDPLLKKHFEKLNKRN